MIPTNRACQVEGREARYIEQGAPDAPPVLLLHGGGLDCAGLSWEHTVPILAEHFRVIAPDLPGYGGTQSFSDPFDIARLGKWTCAFLDSLALDRYTVAGISMGGGTALWLALNAPDRVTRLCAVAAYGLAHKAPAHLASWLGAKLPLTGLSYRWIARSRRLARMTLATLFADPDRIDDAMIADIQTIAEDQAERQSFAAFQRAEIGPGGLRSVFMDRLGAITAPTLFLHGAEDKLVPLSFAEQAAARVPVARLEVLPTGHWPMRERPDLFNPALLSFLREGSD